MEDVVKEMGHLCLGSRLKRLGERMQADVQKVIDEAGLPIQTSHYPLLAAIDRNGPLTVGYLVEALGVSQPGVTRSIARLADIGFVEVSREHRDQRRKTVSLTASGREAVERSKRDVWPRIEAAVKNMCADLSGPLLEQLGAVEEALSGEPLDKRAARAGEKR